MGVFTVIMAEDVRGVRDGETFCEMGNVEDVLGVDE